jgi:hypothetical protein
MISFAMHCPKCGSPKVEEQTNYAKATGRTWWVCGTFQTRECHPHYSELCLEREEKNTLQAKLDDLQASTDLQRLSIAVAALEKISQLSSTTCLSFEAQSFKATSIACFALAEVKR